MVEQPAGANIVDSQWVLCIKKNAAGEVEKYKARLVAKGFTQIYSINFYEMYAPIARLASFRLRLTIAAQNDWPVDVLHSRITGQLCFRLHASRDVSTDANSCP